MTNSPGPPPSVYVDTCVYADLIGRNGEMDKGSGVERWRTAKSVFEAVNTDRVVLAASALTQAEVKCLGDYRNNVQSAQDLVQGWFTARSTIWTDVDRFLADDAAKLAKKWHPHRENKARKKFGAADAIHLAAAVRLGCDYFFTHDEGFPIGMEVDGGVMVLRPTVVWTTTLEDELAEQLAIEREKGPTD